MRRILFTVLASAALVALTPAAALARHHHARHHRTHHSRAHLRRFGSLDPVAPGGNPGGNPGTGDQAGTVASFTGGVLTITLTDGSTVSGTVTDATELECQSAAPTTTPGGEDAAIASSEDNGGENSGGEDNGGSGDNGGGDNGDDNGADNGGNQTCTSTALTFGTVVQEAELKLSSAGAVWDKVDLISG